MNHALGAGSIAQPVDRKSSTLPLLLHDFKQQMQLAECGSSEYLFSWHRFHKQKHKNLQIFTQIDHKKFYYVLYTLTHHISNKTLYILLKQKSTYSKWYSKIINIYSTISRDFVWNNTISCTQDMGEKVNTDYLYYQTSS